MTTILLILVGVSAVGAGHVISEIMDARKQKKATREQMGDAYDEYLKQRRR